MDPAPTSSKVSISRLSLTLNSLPRPTPPRPSPWLSLEQLLNEVLCLVRGELTVEVRLGVHDLGHCVHRLSSFEGKGAKEPNGRGGEGRGGEGRGGEEGEGRGGAHRCWSAFTAHISSHDVRDHAHSPHVRLVCLCTLTKQLRRSISIVVHLPGGEGRGGEVSLVLISSPWLCDTYLFRL